MVYKCGLYQVEPSLPEAWDFATFSPDLTPKSGSSFMAAPRHLPALIRVNCGLLHRSGSNTQIFNIRNVRIR